MERKRKSEGRKAITQEITKKAREVSRKKRRN
jgi:hypothetical protein